MASTGLAVATPVKDATPAVRRSSALRDWLDHRIERSQSKTFSERTTITPELARMLLEHNKDNRKIRPSKLQQLKDDMNAGRFKFNGEAIILAKTGELNDGQHRLQAIVETNKPQDMMIVFGVERETRFTVDTGAARSAGDHLTVAGWPYAAAISAVARTVIGYERTKGTSLGKQSDISSAEVLNKANTDKLLQECASYVAASSNKFKKIGKTRILGFCFYQFSLRKPQEAKTFMDKLRSGTDLNETSPIRLLREYLMMRPGLTETARAELIVRAWNAWITDKPIKQLRLTHELPKIEG